MTQGNKTSDQNAIEEVLLKSTACCTSFCVQCADVETAVSLVTSLNQSWQTSLGNLNLHCCGSAVVGVVRLHRRARYRIPALACAACRLLDSVRANVQSATYTYDGPEGEVRAPIQIAA